MRSGRHKPRRILAYIVTVLENFPMHPSARLLLLFENELLHPVVQGSLLRHPFFKSPHPSQFSKTLIYMYKNNC